MEKKIIMFIPSIEGGGVEKNFFIVSNYLSKYKKVSVITISKSYKPRFNSKIKFITTKYGSLDKLGRRSKYFIALFLLLKEILKNKKIIVLSFQANIYCLLLCKLFGINIIIRSNSSPSGWTKNFIKNLIFKLSFPLADKIIVNSKELKQQLKKKFNINSVNIYNPLNLKEIRKKSQYGRIKFFKKENSLKILNIGRYVEQKDQLTLIKALKLLKNSNYEAIIVGKGKLKNKMQKYILQNNLEKKIRLIDFMNNPYPIIKQSDIFILSSIFEGLPNVLLESLALNKFIISSSCPTGPKEILLYGKGGLLFEVRNYKQLSKKITYYLNNKKKCKLMLNKSTKSLDRFNYDTNLKLYLNIINQI